MKAAQLLVTVCLITLTFNQPWAATIVVPDMESSLQKAIDKAEDGDTVFVKNGTYREPLILKEGITLLGESTLGTVIQGSPRKPVIKGADRAIICKLTIEKGEKGILCENTNTIIEQTIIRDNKGSGIHCLISLPAIRNNAICRNEWSGIYCESVKSFKNIIEHNVIAENGYSGIVLSGKTEVIIEHNVLFRNKKYGAYVGDDSRRSRLLFNDFFENRTPYNSAALADRTNISEDPLFLLSESGSFDYFGSVSAPLKGKGRDGIAIGLISDSQMREIKDDPDNDGVAGELDKCPNIPEDKDGFEDEDGCPDFDNDKDGIYDAQDKCPNEPEDLDGFMDSDGCPDSDNDKDGIPDSLDNCPMNAETINGFKDDDGCPDALPADQGTGKN